MRISRIEMTRRGTTDHTVPTMLRHGGKSCILMTVDNYRYVRLVGRVLSVLSVALRSGGLFARPSWSSWILSCPTLWSPWRRAEPANGLICTPLHEMFISLFSLFVIPLVQFYRPILCYPRGIVALLAISRVLFLFAPVTTLGCGVSIHCWTRHAFVAQGKRDEVVYFQHLLSSLGLLDR